MTGLKIISTLCFLATIHLSAGAVHAAENLADNAFVQAQNPLGAPDNTKPAYGGWSLNVDNDLFSGGARNRDYTGGIAFAVTGACTRDWLFSLDRARETLTCPSGFERLFENQPPRTRHTIEFGSTLFIPGDW